MDREERRLFRRCGENPSEQECWLELSRFYAEKEDWAGAIFAAGRGLEGVERMEISWQLYDVLCAAYYYRGNYPRALAAGEEALKRRPTDRRLRDNLRRIRQKLTD